MNKPLNTATTTSISDADKLSTVEQKREEILHKLRSTAPIIDKTIPAAPAVVSTFSASSYQRKPGAPGKR